MKMSPCEAMAIPLGMFSCAALPGPPSPLKPFVPCPTTVVINPTDEICVDKCATEETSDDIITNTEKHSSKKNSIRGKYGVVELASPF